MSAPVDVLAVLRWQHRIIKRLHDASGGVDHALDLEDSAATISAVAELINLLRISAGNVRSLAAAGALEALPHGPYSEWLRQLDAAFVRVGGGK